jgi:hypothetical protein
MTKTVFGSKQGFNKWLVTEFWKLKVKIVPMEADSHGVAMAPLMANEDPI